MNKYVAIDIGASSGRLMLSSRTEDGKLTLEEMYRFKNGFSKKNGTDYWDIDHLLGEILTGLEVIKKAGIQTCYVGIDTWGVDYCLLDEAGVPLSAPISYRDGRTADAIYEFDQRFSLEKLYQKTGIQLQPFNTIFQLLKENEEKLAATSQFLLMPDYLGFLLTGKAVMEKTNASTTQLMNLETRKLDPELLAVIQAEEKIFPRLTEPGTILGPILKEQYPDYDLPDAIFITIASHDTASAVVGTPAEGENWAFISSGTWSLMGMELEEGISNQAAYDANFTNEWGVQGTIRFLKNIMGMWLIQEVARMQDYQYSYPELAELAAQEASFQQFIDVNDPRFLNPENMIEELQNYCRETHQKVPKTPGELARCIYDNLALCYGSELKNLETITHQKVEKLHIVGGGSNNAFLNQLTADVCGIEVEAGPSEATAIGNIIVQMVATKGFGNLAQARKEIKHSFELKTYHPDPLATPSILNDYQNFIKKGSFTL